MSFHEKLTRIIEQSRSDNDNEALVAIRTAHRLVDKNGLRWDTIIINDAPETPKEFVPRPRPDEPDYLRMLQEIRDSVMPGFDFSFVDSCEDWYRKKRFLTSNQRRALNNIYERVVLKR